MERESEREREREKKEKEREIGTELLSIHGSNKGREKTE